MSAHRHAWVDCTHPTGPCGLLVCVYCGKKRRKAADLGRAD